MGFNLKTHVCETCGHTFISGSDLIIKCDKEKCEKTQLIKEIIKENVLVIPKKDIRVGGC